MPAARAVLALALGFSGLAACSDRSQRPNVLLVVVDTLRADHLGCYGYPRPTSPHIDALAAEGSLFENAIASSSWTGPSIASLFTSVHPGVHRLTTLDARLPGRLRTLAEVFRSNGYATAGFSANFAVVSSQRGFARGFDAFVELHRAKKPFEREDLLGRVAADARRLSDRAIAWLGEGPAPPFFLYLHYMDPHSGYHPPLDFVSRVNGGREVDGSSEGETDRLKRVMRGEASLAEVERLRLIDLYDGEIAFADAEIGRLLAELRRRDLLDRSIVVLLADHGEEFLDHGGLLHGFTLYREQIRVPLIVRLPGGRPDGRRIAEVVGLIDVGPTLLELAGIPDDRSVQGRSLAGLVRGDGGEAAFDAEFAFSELDPDPLLEAHVQRARKHRAAVTGRRWSFLAGASSRSELYELTGDADQRIDRASSEPDRAAAMQRRLDSHLARLPRQGEVERAALGAEERERLRALGYLQ